MKQVMQVYGRAGWRLMALVTGATLIGWQSPDLARFASMPAAGDATFATQLVGAALTTALVWHLWELERETRRRRAPAERRRPMKRAGSQRP